MLSQQVQATHIRFWRETGVILLFCHFSKLILLQDSSLMLTQQVFEIDVLVVVVMDLLGLVNLFLQSRTRTAKTAAEEFDSVFCDWDLEGQQN